MDLLAQWLISNQTNQGDFVYQINTSTGIQENYYNITRQTLASYSLSLYYRKTNNQQAKEALEKSFSFLQGSSEKVIKNVSGKELITQRVNYKGTIQNNASAFTLLSLINYMEVSEENKQKFLPYARDLANYLIGTQTASGGYMYQDNSEVESPYNDSEIFYALVRMYMLDKNNIYLESAKKASRYFLNKYEHTINLSFYSWGNHGFYYLYEIEPDEKYWQFLKESRDRFFSLVGNNYQDFFEKRGGIAPKDPEVFVEGLNYLAKLSHDKNDPFYPRLKKFIDETLNYTLSLQINGPGSYRKSRYKNLNGALCFDYYCNIVRVDATAHNLAALTFYLDNFKYGK